MTDSKTPLRIGQYGMELNAALTAARTAGERIISQINNLQATKIGLEFKAQVDQIANTTIVETLQGTFPNDSFLTEETGFPENSISRLWVIDPLDGTTNFLNGSKFYSTLIAFVENNALVLGVSYLPATDELLWTVKGKGAHLGNKRLTISSKVHQINQASIFLDPGYHPQGEEKLSQAFQQLRPKVGNILMLNANWYALSLLAKGEIPALVHFYSKIWECAGILLAQEAGGKVTDFRGRPLKLDFTQSDGFAFIASNGLIHHQLVQILRP